jgi:hypothetical protein
MLYEKGADPSENKSADLDHYDQEYDLMQRLGAFLKTRHPTEE